jgi:uncharacterized membrane protein
MSSLRKDILYGLFIVVPLASLFWIIDISVDVITGPFSQLLGIHLNTMNGLLLSFSLVWGIGFLARQIISKSIFPKLDAVMVKLPLIRVVYRSLRHIAGVLLKKKHRFLATVFIEYPSSGIWSMGFLTNAKVKCMVNTQNQTIIQQPVAVFIPSTPNPTNGIFVFIDQSNVHHSPMTVEDGIKCLMSAGMITPNLQQEVSL